MRSCFNSKTFIALAVAGVAVFVLVPGAGRALGPLLIAAACPLSMLFMMRAMGGSANRTGADAATTTAGRSEAVSTTSSDDLATLKARIAELEARTSEPSPPDR